MKDAGFHNFLMPFECLFLLSSDIFTMFVE